MKYSLLSVICLLFTVHVCGQGCGVSGSSVPEAVLIDPSCGPLVFVRDSVPACSNGFALPAVCSAGGASYTNKDPNWYHFFCLKSGTLHFTITPEDNSDDYNWMLFDVTGRSWQAGVFKDPSAVVGGNWSEETGETGTSADGEEALVCPGPSSSAFSTMPHLLPKHSYLLLISHYSGSVQHGYTLSLGGTAVIADTTPPPLKEAEVACDGRSITVFVTTDTINTIPHRVFIKGITPGSLAADGSDFKLLHTSVGIQSASSRSTGLNMTKFVLKLDGQLTPGPYALVMQRGSDGNTLLDKCGKGIPVGNVLNFYKAYVPPMSMRNVVPFGCTAKSIRVVFSGKIKCNSIAKNGSDFSIVNVNTGKHLAITGAESISCKNNVSDTVQITLADPILQQGTYHLILRKGTDGNTAISTCDVAPPSGQAVTFESGGAVSAAIRAKLQYACNKVNVTLSNPGENGVYQWIWNSSSGKKSFNASFSFTDTSFRTQTVRLSVSNGVCSDKDSITLNFNKDYYLHAGFTLPAFSCPQDPVEVSNESRGGHIMQWDWDFGNGTYSHRENPGIQHYPATTLTKDYPVSLTITNSKGCSDTALKTIKVINTCETYIPTAFTPNHDGKNDYLYPLNAYLARDLSFKVYNRWGQLVFRTRDRTRGWDGTFHGKPLPEGAYVWVLHFVNSKTGKKVFRKGSSLLIR